MTLLSDYLKPDEVEGLRELRRNVESARRELARLNGAITDVDAHLTRLAYRRPIDAAAAAARFLGELPALETPAPSEPAAPQGDPEELRRALQGLRERRQEAEAELSRAEGAFRSSLLNALVVHAANRAAAEYVDAAEKLSEAWTLLSSAQELEMLAVGASGRVPRYIVPGMTWHELHIPGTDAHELPALKRVSRRVDRGVVLFSGEEAQRAGAPRAALTRLAAELRDLVGDWPFDRRS